MAKEFRQVTFAAAGTADLMGDSVTTGFESALRSAPMNGVYSIRVVSSAATATIRVQCGSETQVDLSPIPGGGTAGVFPSETDSTPIEFTCLQGSKVSMPISVTAAQSVMAVIEFVEL